MLENSNLKCGLCPWWLRIAFIALVVTASLAGFGLLLPITNLHQNICHVTNTLGRKNASLAKLLEYTPSADHDALSRGVYTLGDRHRLRRFVDKLLSGQPVTVVMSGGSVTIGQGAIYDHPYAKRFFQWIQETFPNPKHVLRNAAMSGITSAVASVCAKTLIPDADLVIIEFTANDPIPSKRLSLGNYSPNDAVTFATMKAYERLIRTVLGLESAPAVVLYHYYSWHDAGGGGNTLAAYYHTIESEYHTLGQYYGLPQLSIRAAFYQLMVENVSRYRADVWRSGNEETTNEEDLFYYDDVSWERLLVNDFRSLTISTTKYIIDTSARRYWACLHVRDADCIAADGG